MRSGLCERQIFVQAFPSTSPSVIAFSMLPTEPLFVIVILTAYTVHSVQHVLMLCIRRPSVRYLLHGIVMLL